MPRYREGLSPKQKLFVEAYVNGLNGAQAAIAAGYSLATARAIASETLRKPAVIEAVRTLREARQAEALAERARVIDRLVQLADSDVFRVFGSDGKILPEHEWPEEAWHTIKRVRYSEKIVKTENGERKRERFVSEIVMHDKFKALRELQKYFRRYKN